MVFTISHLPTEIIERIISSVWMLPLTTSERASFMNSSLLVSSSWRSVFVMVATTDIYILGPSYAKLFLSALRRRGDTTMDTLCRSITIQHSNSRLLDGPDFSESHQVGFVIKDVLSELHSSPTQLPHLRRISIELQNQLDEMIFEYNENIFSRFPTQVTDLDLIFTYGEDVNHKTRDAIKFSRRRFGLKGVRSSHLRNLTVLGSSMGVAQEIVGVFGGIDRLESFTQDAWKERRVIVAPLQEDEEEFFDCEEQPEVDSWKGYEQRLAESFSKTDLTRILSAMQRVSI